MNVSLRDANYFSQRLNKMKENKDFKNSSDFSNTYMTKFMSVFLITSLFHGLINEIITYGSDRNNRQRR